VIKLTDQENQMEEAPQSGPAQTGKPVVSHTTLIAAIVVLAAVALIIILINR
jgi:hypothetical protein